MPTLDTRSRITLPPSLRLAPAPEGVSAFDAASRDASECGAGALVVGCRPDLVDFAVVLEPDEPLRSARLAFVLGMVALIEAVGAVAPPEKPLTIVWPDTFLFDGARLGGGRLGWPAGADEADPPDWLVFGATLIGSKRHAGDPGLTPGSTSLEEEGFGPDDDRTIVESFARFLLRLVDGDRDGGREAALRAYRARLANPSGEIRPALDSGGNLLPGGGGAPRSLAAALGSASWLDPATGTPRL